MIDLQQISWVSFRCRSFEIPSWPFSLDLQIHASQRYSSLFTHHRRIRQRYWFKRWSWIVLWCDRIPSRIRSRYSKLLSDLANRIELTLLVSHSLELLSLLTSKVRLSHVERDSKNWPTNSNKAVFANGLLSRSLPVHLAHMEVLIHESPSSFVKSTSTSDREGSNSSSKRTANSQGVETLTYLYRCALPLWSWSNIADPSPVAIASLLVWWLLLTPLPVLDFSTSLKR